MTDTTPADDLARLQAEIARLRDFCLRLAERIFLAHEVLGRLAERRTKQGEGETAKA